MWPPWELRALRGLFEGVPDESEGLANRLGHSDVLTLRMCISMSGEWESDWVPH